MKGFRIAINIILILELIAVVTFAILWPTVFLNDALASLSESTEGTSSSAGEAIGKGIAAGLAAMILVVIFYGLTAVFILVGIVNLVAIICYNVSKYPRMGLGIITLLFVNIVAGILMLIHRSKYLKQPNGI